MWKRLLLSIATLSSAPLMCAAEPGTTAVAIQQKMATSRITHAAPRKQ